MCLHNLGFCQLGVALVGLRDHACSQLQEGISRGAGGVECSRGSGVAVLADTLHERDLSQQGLAGLLGQLLHAFVAEDVVAVLGQFGGREP